MKQKINEAWQNTPTLAKVGVGILGLYILSKSLKNLKSLVSGDGLGANYGTDLNKLEKVNIVPSYADSTYLGFADQIYREYMTEAFFEDIDDIVAIFSKMNNDADMLKLDQAFGQRRALFTTQKANLSATLSRMFDRSEIDKINAVMKRKGLKARF